MFRYKAKHDVMCKEDVLELVNATPDGLAIDEIADAYVKAVDDAIALAEEDGSVILLTNTETKKKVLFRKQPEYEVEVNEEFVASFHEVEIPEHDVDFDKALRREGIEPTPRPVYDLGPQPELIKEKKKRAVNFERMNVTNAHMPELFKAAQVDRLDG
jgi:transcription initiation factor TFIIE subunit beta